MMNVWSGTRLKWSPGIGNEEWWGKTYPRTTSLTHISVESKGKEILKVTGEERHKNSKGRLLPNVPTQVIPTWEKKTFADLADVFSNVMQL